MLDKNMVPEIRFKGFIKEWEQEELKNLVVPFSGLTNVTKEDFSCGKDYYVTYLNVFSNPIAKLESLEKVNIHSKQNNLIKGDILVTGSSETPEEVGMTSIWNYNLQNVYLNSFCFGLRPKGAKKINIDFSGYLFRSLSVRKQIILLAQGISRFNISKNKFLELSLIFPFYNEQQKIGQFFSSLDSLIQFQEQKLKKLQTIKQSLLNKILVSVDQKIPEIRFKGFDEDWEQTKLSEVVLKFDNLRVPVAESLRTKGTYPYYGANGIQDYVSGFTHNGEFVLIAEDGANDLDNYPSNYVNGRFWANNHVHVLQGTIDTIDNKFLNYLFKKIDFKPLLTGGDRAKLTAGALDTIYIKISTFLEQRKIGLLLNNIDLLIHSQEQKLEKLNNIKQALLEKMFC
ncbi:restriction endonuclease subunit S [Mycoplasma sp. Z355B]|uniref:restriction endonuclease subunit S n=1 Tax=Mycoplasma sp. Z355B TaxID=3401689 RepID=UPI003AAD3C41